MAGIILNGSVIKGLILNGSPVTAILDGVKVFPTEAPQPAATLLYEQAVQNYTTSGYDDDPPVIMSSRTWDTNKNFICYKVNLKINSNSNNTGLSISTSDDRRIIFGTMTKSYLSLYSANDTYFRPYQAGTATAGSDGSEFRTGYYGANPLINATTALIYKVIFDKTQNKAYCYITNKQVMVLDYGSYAMLTARLETGYNVNLDCGIQVYACDSLAAAEAL